MRLLERAAQLDRELRTATAEVVSTRKQLTSEHRKLKRITVQHQQVKDRLVTAQAELVRLRDRLRFERDQNVRRSERLGRHGHDGVLGESADFADTDPFDDWSE